MARGQAGETVQHRRPRSAAGFWVSSSIAEAASAQLSTEALTRTHRAPQERIRALVERGRADGAFRRDLPVDWLMACFFGLLHTCGAEVRAGRLDADEALPALSRVLVDLLSPRHPEPPGDTAELR